MRARPEIVLLLPLLVCTMALGADEWRWNRIAWGGRSLGSVICQYDSSNVVYVTLPEYPNPPEERGVYKSIDGGLTWHFLPGSDSIPDPSILSSNPRNFRELYCGSALWYAQRTRDAGQGWEIIPALLQRIDAPAFGKIAFSSLQATHLVVGIISGVPTMVKRGP